MHRHESFMVTHVSASLLLSDTWNLSCNNILLNARINGLSSIKVVNCMEIPMSEIFSSNTSTKSILLVLIIHPRMVLLNVLTVPSLMVSTVVWLVLVFPSHTGPLLFFMSYVYEMLFLVMNKDLLLFICWPERRTTSRIFEHSAVEFGSALQVFKQRDSRIKHERVSSLAIFLTPHEISFGMMLSPNNVKL